jgi:hypothetical protein
MRKIRGQFYSGMPADYWGAMSANNWGLIRVSFRIFYIRLYIFAMVSHMPEAGNIKIVADFNTLLHMQIIVTHMESSTPNVT